MLFFSRLRAFVSSTSSVSSHGKQMNLSRSPLCDDLPGKGSESESERERERETIFSSKSTFAHSPVGFLPVSLGKTN